MINFTPGRDASVGRLLRLDSLIVASVCAGVISLCFVRATAAQDAPPRWEMTEDLRIGAVEGPNALSAVHRLTVDARGDRVYVPQEMSGRVRVFDARSGESLYSMGRSGEGPGEFRLIGVIGWTADTLYVTDFLLARISYFSPDGDFYRTGPTLRMTGGGNHIGIRPVGVTATGKAIVQERLDARYVADGSADGSPWSIQGSNEEDWQILARQNLQGNTTAVPMVSGLSFCLSPIPCATSWLLHRTAGPSSC